MLLTSFYSVDNFTAEDTDGQAATMSPTTGLPKSPHSFFNKALREALTVKGKNIQDIYQLVLKSTCHNNIMCET